MRLLCAEIRGRANTSKFSMPRAFLVEYGDFLSCMSVWLLIMSLTHTGEMLFKLVALLCNRTRRAMSSISQALPTNRAAAAARMAQSKHTHTLDGDVGDLRHAPALYQRSYDGTILLSVDGGGVPLCAVLSLKVCAVVVVVVSSIMRSLRKREATAHGTVKTA